MSASRPKADPVIRSRDASPFSSSPHHAAVLKEEAASRPAQPLRAFAPLRETKNARTCLRRKWLSASDRLWMLSGSGILRDMKIIELDASAWSSEDDFYSALLSALGSPGWHGHNLNALWDSLTSDINEVEPPLSVVVRHANHLAAHMTALFEGVSEVFADARSERGLDVHFSVS